MEPKRIQRKRTKGWKMPPNTVYVGRPTPWGNPFGIASQMSAVERRQSIELYRVWLLKCIAEGWWETDIKVLCGKNLACWCSLDQPCHADVLLELANAVGA